MRTLQLTLIVGLALVSAQASAQNDASCTIAGGTRIDSILNPAIGEDDSFLGGKSRGLPYIAFVIDTSEHMRRFSVDIVSDAVRAQGLGCSNTILNSLVYEANPCVDGKGQPISWPLPAHCNSATLQPHGYGEPFNPTRSYVPYDPDFSGLFDQTRWYRHDRGWGADSTKVDNSYRYNFASDACAFVPAGEQGNCQTCVTTKGYYLPLSTANAPVLWGKWINFNPPKYVIARKVLKDQFAALDAPSRTRQTMLTIVDSDARRCFSDNKGNTGMDPNRDGAALIGNPTRFKPPCNQFSNCNHNGSSGGGRAAFDNQVNGQSTLFTSPNGACPVGVPVPLDAPAGTASVGFSATPDGVCHGEFRTGGGAKLADAICAPYAEALLNAGQYLGDQNLYDSFFPISPAGRWRKGDFDNSDSICGPNACGCPRPTIILIAGGPPSFDDNLPCEITGLGCASTLPGPACGSSGAIGNLARVAQFLATKNMKPSQTYPNASRVGINTYVIGFGTRTPSLAAAAEAGNGQFFGADSAAQLRSAINDALQAVSSAQLSFSNANVTTVQTRTSSSLLVPRFTPSRKAIWKGHLYHFQLISEGACGCKETVAPEPFHECDFNKDRQCGGAFFKDGNDKWIAADAEGVFRVASPQAPVAGDFVPGTTEATPLWDAATALNSRTSQTGLSNSRRIFTVVDSNGDGLFDHRDNTVPFDETQVATLLPYFNIGPDDFCATLANRLETCLSANACATKVIQYVRGMDIFDEDCDGNRTEDRAEKLGDIYHSSPIVVDPPLAKNSLICRLGLHNQCMTVLHDEDVNAAHHPPEEPGNGYAEYAERYRHRDKVVLVGANDGMLHAFHSGDWVAGDNPRTTTINECANPPDDCPGYYNDGTGDEIWAFIPPDLLPKLPRMLEGKHQYYVDGTPMIRDIWHDDDGNGKKKSTEYRTVAVVGERRGGQHYFALDVTNSYGPPDAPAPGFFRWLYPQPNTAIARVAGESFSEFLPAPPPIGPVRVKWSTPTGLKYLGIDVMEKWVVALSGGYDQANLRGRFVSLVDVWNGGAHISHPRHALWTFDAGPNGYPFAATAAMTGYGTTSPVATGILNDSYFDTMTIGDTGGQLWALRFNHPDHANWAGGRILNTVGAAGVCARQPFFHTSTLSIADNGWLRVLAGTGDRFNLSDIAGGECSATNLTGCLRRGCTLVSRFTRTICGKTASFERHYSAANSVNSCGDVGSFQTIDPAVDNTCCGKITDAQLEYELRCTNSNGAINTMRWEPRVDCGPSSANVCGTPTTGYTCTVSNDTPFDICSTFDRCEAPITPVRNGLYAMKVFDANGTGRQHFDTPAQAATFDSAAKTAAHLVQADLYTATAPGVMASKDALGWYGLYGLPNPPGHVYPQTPLPFNGDAINERTVIPATVVNGCTIWSTLTPANSTSACSSSRLSVNTQYRVSMLTGGACTDVDDDLFNRRYVQSQDTLPPAPPQMAVAVSPTGAVSIQLLSISRTSGGEGQITKIDEQESVSKKVGDLNISRELHECRHPDGLNPADQATAARASCPPP